jgi:hypothetical protein
VVLTKRKTPELDFHSSLRVLLIDRAFTICVRVKRSSAQALAGLKLGKRQGGIEGLVASQSATSSKCAL